MPQTLPVDLIRNIFVYWNNPAFRAVLKKTLGKEEINFDQFTWVLSGSAARRIVRKEEENLDSDLDFYIEYPENFTLDHDKQKDCAIVESTPM